MAQGTPAVLRVPQPAADAADWPIEAEVTHLAAAAGWKAIDLVSDLHLDPSHPQTAEALFHYITHTRADAVLLLGDVFEAWVGDDVRHQAFEARCVQALRQAAKHRWLGIMAGNRDFLMGPELMSACGAHALPDPLILSVWGQRLLITHGDAWCLDDTAYLHFRAQVRQPAWQQAFLSQPLSQRLNTARQMRQASEARKAGSSAPETWADVDSTRACAWLRATHTQVLIHGHTHRPGRSSLESAVGEPTALMREVLSDWDLDDVQCPRAEVLRLDTQGMHRITPLMAASR